MKAKCATCPFNAGGWSEVRPLLEQRALTQATPICHSTGSHALSKKVHKKAHACRGARDLQLRLFASLGFIESATDEAWAKKHAEMERSKCKKKKRKKSVT